MKFLDLVASHANEGAYYIQKNSPTIMTVSGIVGMVGAAVLACRATAKLNDILDEGLEKKTIIAKKMSQDGADEKDINKELAKVSTQTAVKVAGSYAPAVILGAASAGMILGSDHIMKKRDASLAAAYMTLDQAFKKYRENVKAEVGEEKEQDIRFGATKEKVEVVDEETGKKKKVEKKKYDIDHNPSAYSRWFGDEFEEGDINYSTKYKAGKRSANLFFLRNQEAYINELLKIKRVIYLNDVYRLLGYKETQAGQRVGWIYDAKTPFGQNRINFNLTEWAITNYLEGYTDILLIDLVPDADLLATDKISEIMPEI